MTDEEIEGIRSGMIDGYAFSDLTADDVAKELKLLRDTLLHTEDVKLLLSTASKDYCADNCDFGLEGEVDAHDTTCEQITAFLQGKSEKRI